MQGRARASVFGLTEDVMDLAFLLAPEACYESAAEGSKCPSRPLFFCAPASATPSPPQSLLEPPLTLPVTDGSFDSFLEKLSIMGAEVKAFLSSFSLITVVSSSLLPFTDVSPAALGTATRKG